MDLSKLLDSIEKLIYEFLLLVIFIPRTLFNLLRPKWSYNYIEKQFALPEEDRFQEQVSPIILFVILVTIPIYLSLSSFPELTRLDINKNDVVTRVMLSKTFSFVDKFVITSLLFSAYPIIYSIILLLRQHLPVTKINFKKPYYHFLYTFCNIYSAFLLMICTVYFIVKGKQSDTWNALFILSVFLFFLYVVISSLITNITIYRRTVPGYNIANTFLVVFIYILVSVPYFIILLAIATTLLNKL